MDDTKRRPSVEADELSHKRLKTEDGAASQPAEEHGESVAAAAPTPEAPMDQQAVKEAVVGITCFVSPEAKGLRGTFKQR